MCERTTCDTCKKPTWAGCGQHIEQALEDVPKEERCVCPGIFARLKSWIGL
ncbi:uncharacterized protein EV154DRAFT_604696 [Mucor mucedo]|uniref:uncharacterized protein n=1 Tax=Mucor mucedo TaxID=29922 RepID=UPI00221F6B1B|nr:uncharacterized protein EV154DRAFT_604696 [Mucor mucedo]KAI7888619.1 hypothetical protein EV154DRAFT_604696 [Mucor mucedo]